MSENKIATEVAQAEIEKWLTVKKISERKRENLKDNISALVDAVSEGSLVVNEKNELEQFLKFPFGETAPVSKLVYKPRITVMELNAKMQGVKANDADGRLTAYIAALANITMVEVKKLDTEDYSIAQNIAIFFL